MVEEHAHCVVCGKVIEPGKKFCSPECELKYIREKEILEKNRRMINILMVLIPILFVVSTIIVGLHLGG